MTEKQLRKIDALVAEHVMGFTLESSGLRPPDWPKDARIDDVDTVMGYSTDIAAAWTVVHKMRDLGAKFLLETIETIETDTDRAKGFEWEAKFGTESAARASIPALAICLAALDVKGVEIPKVIDR